MAGGSALAGLFPHTPDYSVQPGRYRFRVRNAGGSSTTINVSAIVKNGVNPSSGTLNVNLVFCGAPDLKAGDALKGETQTSQKFLIMFNTFKQIFRDAAHIEIAAPTLIDCSGAATAVVAFLSGSDFNQNGQSDELDDLFRLHQQDVLLELSSKLPENALTFFFIPVAEMPLGLQGLVDLLGVSGGIPGPAFTPGTRHSGVAVGTGNLANQAEDELKTRGETMAHEAAHFLGLFHTTEQNGRDHDPISDTPECHIATNDANRNNILEAGECLNLDGGNLMFWTSGRDIRQVRLTEGQRLVLHRNPLIH